MRIDLNLLPPQKKKELLKSLILAHFQLMCFVCLVVAVGLVGTLVLVRGQVKRNFNDVQAAAAGMHTEKTADITEQIKQINLYLKDIKDLQNKHISWTDVVDNIMALVPPKVRLESLTMEEGGQIRLTGMAATRDDALTMLKSLRETAYLTDVVSPLSNILQKENVNFEFTMKFVPPKPAEAKPAENK